MPNNSFQRTVKKLRFFLSANSDFRHTMDQPRKSYKAATLHILGGFQLLEFALKAYIGRVYSVINVYSVIKKSVGEELHFDYSAQDVEELPLERLLNIKLNANGELIPG